MKFQTKRLVEIDDATYPLAPATVAWYQKLDEIAALGPASKRGKKPKGKANPLEDVRRTEAWADAMIVHCVPEFPAEQLPELGIPVKTEIAAALREMVTEVDATMGADRPPDSADGTGS